MSTATNRYWFLDSVAGWQESTVSSNSATRLARTTPDGDLTLEPLPGTAQLFQGTTPPAVVDRRDPAWATLQSQLACPVAFNPDPCGRELYVLDASDGRVATMDLTTGEIRVLRGVGGCGPAARQLEHPRGIAVLANDSLVIADTENHRVQIFTTYPHALIQLWDGFKWPWGVAVDARGTIVYVVDRGNKRIRKFRSDGSLIQDIGAGVLQDPTDLAVSPAGDVAVIDSAKNVVVFPGGGGRTLVIEDVPSPMSLAFDADSGLYVGTAAGLVYKLLLDRNTLEGYVVIGAGVSGLADPIVSLKWLKNYGLLAIMRESANDDRQRIWQMSAAGSYALEGSIEINPLDSGIENCVWHRVQLNAVVPAGASILVESATCAVAEEGGPAVEFSDYVQCVLAGYDDADCLVQSTPGQLLKLRVTLRSNGVDSPTVHWMKAFFPRDSYLRYLPAVFQQDPESRSFMERFLSIFQASFDDLDRRIDQFRLLFDPMQVPEEFLPYLSGWLALTIDPTWTVAQRRSMLKKALADDLRRGTPAGLAQAIQDYAGPDMHATILENFRLRRWPTLPAATALSGGLRLWSRDVYQRLQVDSYSRVGSFRLTNAPQPVMEPLDWGANRFTVFFKSDPYRADAIEKRVSQVVEREKPAHTVATLCPVFPRFRVGIQATVGVDSYIGQISNLVLNSKQADGTAAPGRLARLGYDSILSCSPAQRNIGLLRSSARPQVGVNARLL